MRGYSSNTQNLLFRVSANPQAILGEVRQGPSPVAPDSGDPSFVCDYVYCKAAVELDPGEIVKLDLTSLATISNHQVTKPTTTNPTYQTAHVVGVVPENLKGVTGDRLTVVPSGYYFWAVQKGVARVLDYAGATVGDVLTVSTSTAGMVDSTGAVGPGVGIALETVGSAGLVKALFKAPLA
jgi:hypothetical protein